MRYKTGLENFLHNKINLVKGKRVGLVTNHTGMTVNLNSSIDLLYKHSDIQLVSLFGPEHGVRGNYQAGIEFMNGIDTHTGLPVYSLYGKNKKLTKNMLKDLEIIIYDIQDLGLRYYTYISTLLNVLESCSREGVHLLVLDRLNPLGRKVEGNIVKSNFRSFVGLYPFPQRHGMTIGELALLVNNEYGFKAKLDVVNLEGWNGEYYDQVCDYWIPPSPNIPHFNTSLVYPISYLFEGTILSEGRGTANPFEYVGAPWIDPFRLVEYLREKKIPGVAFRPVYFVPHFSKHKGVECGGVQIFVKDRKIVNTNLTGLIILKSVLELYPEKEIWLKPEKDNKYFFDLLLGTDTVRKDLQNGKDPFEIVQSWEEERKEFMLIREKYLIY